jgi:hypothetical protein
MTRLNRGARVLIAAAALTVAAMSTVVPVALAAGSGVPFTDANAVGALTFCSRTGQPVTSGSLYTIPFAWKAVSSSPAPAGYRASTARATLYAYQPIKFVAPGDWSGEQLTGSSTYTNADHPVVQATNGDTPMVSFVGAYPPHWQGLVQLRLLFTAVNAPVHNETYPAAVIRIKGHHWTLVSGGGTQCSESNGVSDETQLLQPSELPGPQTAIPAGASARPSAKHKQSHPGASSRAGAVAATPAAARSTSALSNGTSGSGLGSGAKAGVGVAVVAALGLAVGVVAWLRRRPSVRS